jgi:hypothetical protein
MQRGIEFKNQIPPQFEIRSEKMLSYESGGKVVPIHGEKTGAKKSRSTFPLRTEFTWRPLFKWSKIHTTGIYFKII